MTGFTDMAVTRRNGQAEQSLLGKLLRPLADAEIRLAAGGGCGCHPEPGGIYGPPRLHACLARSRPEMRSPSFTPATAQKRQESYGARGKRLQSPIGELP